MKIRLKNIGIIEDSSILLDGLTVITGRNNSGKTTVGKTVYSLIDAVSNQTQKYKYDREKYIKDRIARLCDNLEAFRYFRIINEDEESWLDSFPQIKQFIQHYMFELNNVTVDEYAIELSKEFTAFDVNVIKNDKSYQMLESFFKDKKKVSFEEKLKSEKKEAIEYIERIFTDLGKDKELINYSRESINQLLKREFAGQIQPANGIATNSEIEISDGKELFFKMTIADNKIIDDGERVFYATPVKRTYFIDNPFVIDSIMNERSRNRGVRSIGEDSIIDSSRILSHQEKVARVIRQEAAPSILEQIMINDRLKGIKKKIDNIIPGTFEFGTSGDYYVTNGVKIRMSNLATGSKMFSIIKRLLETGKLDDSTILILDEPEAHLHPEWQNDLAEIIVLLVKELGVKVLLTSHSSNFVLAIDAFVRKNSIEGISHFYQTNKAHNNMIQYKCVDDDIGVIYQDFLEYLSQVKVLRDQFIHGNEDE